MKTPKEYADMFWTMGELLNRSVDRQRLEAVISRAMRAATKEAQRQRHWNTLDDIPIIDPVGGWPDEKPKYTSLRDVTIEQEFVIPPSNCHPNEILNFSRYKLCYTPICRDKITWVYVYAVHGGNVKLLSADTQVVIVT